MPPIPHNYRKKTGGSPLGDFIRRLEAKTEFDASRYKGGGMAFDFSSQATLLHLTLEAAVPLWIEQLREYERDMIRRGTPEEFGEYLTKRASECANYIAEYGDCLMFRVKDKSAAAFNRLAEGIACLSFCPGGVEAFGTRWEMKRINLEVK